MPLCAAICRSLERKLLIFLGLGFFFEPEGRGFESLPARQPFQVVTNFFEFLVGARGRIGPFGAEFCERKIDVVVAHRVCVDAKRERRVGGGLRLLALLGLGLFTRLAALAILEARSRPPVAHGPGSELPAPTCIVRPPLYKILWHDLARRLPSAAI